MSTPQKATLTGSVTWSDGSPFDGWVCIITNPPLTGTGVGWPSISLEGNHPRTRIPRETWVSITGGVYNQTTPVWFNGDLQPPGVRYAAYFYDLGKVLIAPLSAAALFDIASNPYTLVPPTLTIPTVSVVSPTPGTLPEETTVLGYSWVEIPAGTKDGVNDTFTLSTANYRTVDVRWNGVTLSGGVGYVVSGATLTMSAGYIPQSTDVFEVRLYP